ncbi:MAG: hypothetical protein DMF98_28615, partial [Acidobacteria bacterium]
MLLLFIIASFEPPVAHAPGLNPIVIENQKASNADWELTNPALEREIEGYASATSVNRGDAIEVF